ncbi:MAG: hypothetical protein ACE5J7_02950 [Candidatus Aenigmatarchaeota archaeon]
MNKRRKCKRSAPQGKGRPNYKNEEFFPDMKYFEKRFRNTSFGYGVFEYTKE